jgi:hypothetical protein
MPGIEIPFTSDASGIKKKMDLLNYSLILLHEI